VLRLIELALKAPTSRNAQHWEFVLVKDRVVKASLARLYRFAWGLYGRIGRRLTASDPQMHRQIEAVQWQVEHFEAIPVLAACLHGFRPVWPPVVVTSYYGSIYPSVQNLLLAARAAGLGAALITLPLWSTWLVRRALALPWRVTPCTVVPLGWPMGRYGPTTRRPVGEVVHLILQSFEAEVTFEREGQPDPFLSTSPSRITRLSSFACFCVPGQCHCATASCGY